MAKQYLTVSYQDKDLVKRLGGRWDATVKKWYCPRGSELSKVFAMRAPQIKMVERAEVHLLAEMKARREAAQPAPESYVPRSYAPKSYAPKSYSKEPAQLSLLG